MVKGWYGPECVGHVGLEHTRLPEWFSLNVAKLWSTGFATAGPRGMPSAHRADSTTQILLQIWRKFPSDQLFNRHAVSLGSIVD
jgi:hypothetical protein